MYFRSKFRLKIQDFTVRQIASCRESKGTKLPLFTHCNSHLQKLTIICQCITAAAIFTNFRLNKQNTMQSMQVKWQICLSITFFSCLINFFLLQSKECMETKKNTCRFYLHILKVKKMPAKIYILLSKNGSKVELISKLLPTHRFSSYFPPTFDF